MGPKSTDPQTCLAHTRLAQGLHQGSPDRGCPDQEYSNWGCPDWGCPDWGCPDQRGPKNRDSRPVWLTQGLHKTCTKGPQTGGAQSVGAQTRSAHTLAAQTGGAQTRRVPRIGIPDQSGSHKACTRLAPWVPRPGLPRPKNYTVCCPIKANDRGT